MKLLSRWSESSLNYGVTFHLENLLFGLLFYHEWKRCKVIFKVLRMWLFQGSNTSPLEIQAITYRVFPQNVSFLYWSISATKCLLALILHQATSSCKPLLLQLQKMQAGHTGYSFFFLVMHITWYSSFSSSPASITSARKSSEISGINSSFSPDVMNNYILFKSYQVPRGFSVAVSMRG